MRKLIKIFHLPLAWILKAVLFSPLFFVNAVIAIIKRDLDDYSTNAAFALDVYGNQLFKYTFNFFFLTKFTKFKYGESQVTISEVTAKNYYAKTLNGFGRFFAKILILFKDKAFFNPKNKSN